MVGDEVHGYTCIRDLGHSVKVVVEDGIEACDCHYYRLQLPWL